MILQGGTGGTAGRIMTGTVKPTYGTSVTAGVGAEIFNDYRERTFSGAYNATETGNIASGEYSHAEGVRTTASGQYSHAEGNSSLAEGDSSHAEGGSHAAAEYAHAEGTQSIADGEGAHSEGIAWASGEHSHAEGGGSTEGKFSHAEGVDTVATGEGSHAEGDSSVAEGSVSHAEGDFCTASGIGSHAGGCVTEAKGNYQTAIGTYNVVYEDNSNALFIIGNGTTTTARSNAFRVTKAGATYAKGSYSSSGADYAEMFQWADGNSDAEDRAGRLVTLDGDLISLARPGDTDLLGIVSGAPSVLGDVYDDQWQGMYLTDVYGRTLWEEIERPARTGPDGEILIPAHKETHMKLNPAYDNTLEYVPRSKRPEWDAVGLLGKLVMQDDGTAKVNGYVKAGEGGIGTLSTERTRFRVMARLDETHVRVLIL